MAGRERGGRQPAGGAEHRSWVVDSIEEGIAALEEDGDRLVHVPAWLLPSGAREGDVLSVECDRAKSDASRIRITADHASREARRISKERPGRTNDPGGDIQL